jgi:Ribonuclease G/E
LNEDDKRHADDVKYLYERTSDFSPSTRDYVRRYVSRILVIDRLKGQALIDYLRALDHITVNECLESAVNKIQTMRYPSTEGVRSLIENEYTVKTGDEIARQILREIEERHKNR